MKRLNIYLSGATKQVDESFQNWRDKCFNFYLNGYYPKLNFVDPISYFNYTNKQPNTDKQCLDFFMWQIEHCDVLLINLDQSNSSCGSCMEVEHAFCNGIPIVAFGMNPETWYNWAETRSSVIFDTLEEAVIYINDFYGTLHK